jgi:DNA-binding response OmpR family regulator
MSNHESDQTIAVLLVDDQRFIGAAVAQVLANEQDIALHYCQHAALAVARANEIRPSVILQDLVMPDIDGLTMVRLFRENPCTASTPVVVLSASDDLGTRSRAKAAGASDYLVKLPNRDEMVACIRRHSVGPRSAPLEIPAPAIRETLGRGVLDELREPDGRSLPEFALMLIDQFDIEVKSQIILLRVSRVDGDPDALKAILHGLKGSALTMGARRLAWLCDAMEQHLASASIDDVPPQMMTDIDLEVVELLAALAAERQHASGPSRIL